MKNVIGRIRIKTDETGEKYFAIECNNPNHAEKWNRFSKGNKVKSIACEIVSIQRNLNCWDENVHQLKCAQDPEIRTQANLLECGCIVGKQVCCGNPLSCPFPKAVKNRQCRDCVHLQIKLPYLSNDGVFVCSTGGPKSVTNLSRKRTYIQGILTVKSVLKVIHDLPKYIPICNFEKMPSKIQKNFNKYVVTK
jgi:hypothetical protein